MSLSYCAIDFETANWFRGSPCAVGLVKVVDGAVVDARRYLMRPPKGYDEFDEFNISLHGITPEMVRHEPRFAQRLPEILAFADGLPFVAHNAAFDIGVIRDACDVSDLVWPRLSYACTLVLSRVTWASCPTRFRGSPRQPGYRSTDVPIGQFERRWERSPPPERSRL